MPLAVAQAFALSTFISGEGADRRPTVRRAPVSTSIEDALALAILALIARPKGKCRKDLKSLLWRKPMAGQLKSPPHIMDGKCPYCYSRYMGIP